MRDVRYEVVRDDEIEEEVLFQLSWGYDPAPLKKSLDQVGQISPLVLLTRPPGYRLVCGYRRRRALKELGVREYHALILAPEVTEQEALMLALEDNLGHRMFNDTEKAMALRSLARFLDPGDLATIYLPRLGLPPTPEFLDRYLKLVELGPEGLDALASGVLDPETAETLLELSPDDRAAASSLLDALRPGLNKRRQILTWLTEIARRDERTLAGILSEPGFRAILDDESLNRPLRTARVRTLLYARRYPVVSRLESERAARMRALRLPPSIRLKPPLNFEGLDFSLEISFVDLEGLRQAGRTVQDLLASPDLAALIELG
ncbi:MAG: ParB N-terminal domain-containing protein [Proteobacteria bacterium]|nr:ParB N-terminal domain-containing protein [Pseudomonadota bacterium]